MMSSRIFTSFTEDILKSKQSKRGVMIMRDAISLRVSSKGVIITLDPERDFSDIKSSLNRYVGEAGDFFAGVNLFVNLNGYNCLLEDMQELISGLSRFEKIENIYFINEKENTKYRTTDTILLNRTIRSGQRIKFPTNIVIIGDINPGAEVIAGGDIIVLGKLRGVVHAGAQGSIKARVVALVLQPTQLRIGNIISRPPDDSGLSEPLRPERAYVKDSAIIVEEMKL